MEKHLNYTEVRWKNFKGFKDTGWIKIKPVTIILGVNNSGKTNFLAPFLLMNQTLNSRDRLSPLILKGYSYDGGNYQEIVKDYITENEIYFGFRYDIHESNKRIGKIGAYPPGGFDITLNVESKDGEIRLKNTTLYDLFGQKFFSLTRTKLGNYKYKGIDLESMTDIEKDSIKNNKPFNFLFSPNSILSYIELKKDEKDKEVTKSRTIRFSEGYSQFLAALSVNISRVQKYLGDLSFLGPIREHPRRIYEITNETYYTVGTRGENMPNLLKKIGDKNKELNSWVSRFDFGDAIQLKHHFSNSYSLRFTKKGSAYYTSIANAGFGASQILPLIVQAVVSPKRSITIAEQPEIHLNPKLQCELADLFVSMANKKQIVIVETHSEHLLLRLRRLVAEGKIDSSEIAIYFVQKEDNDSIIREITLEKNGHIKPIDWPKNFFGESLKEALLMATEQAKSKIK